MDLSLVVPCFNEAENVEAIVLKNRRMVKRFLKGL